MPEGPGSIPKTRLTDLPLRLLAAEITREQLFLQLHQELPYASTVETDNGKERTDGSVEIDQTIHVERESQKAIVLGKGGAQIKRIGELARAELERSSRAPRPSVPVRPRHRGLGRRSRTPRRAGVGDER